MNINKVINKDHKVLNIIINKKIQKKINYSFGYGRIHVYYIYFGCKKKQKNKIK